MDLEHFYHCLRQPGFIPGYEIQNRLGGGAFGDVYKARKVSIGKSYAIKFLRLDDAEGRGVIERELEQVRFFAAIDHPNLVSIEDMGVVIGVPYVIMGYAGEDTLARRLRRGRIDRDQAVAFFLQACQGVHALHERRLAHLDLKPSNVFLKGEIARVGDYGLARLMADGRRTISFGRGTPHYMAPEILGNQADLRADLYSLGVILYECVAGRVPFEPVAGIGLVVRPDDRPPEFPDDFPGPLREPIVRSLHVAPEDRHASITDLMAEVERAVELLAEARRGGAPAARPQPPVPAPPVPAPPCPIAEPARGELRGLAADLARGAAEVVLGLLDGVRAGWRRGGSGAGPTPPAAPGSGEEGGAGGGTRRVVAPPGSASPRTTDSRGAGRVALARHPPPFPALEGGRVTIPVPPPVEAGALGTLGTSLALGLEVLVSLLIQPLRWLGSAVSSSPRTALRSLGLLSLLLLLALAFTWTVVQAIAR